MKTFDKSGKGNPKKAINVLSFRLKSHAREETGALRSIEILVDGKPIVDGDSLTVDVPELVRSKHHDGRHYFFCCSCGDMECGRVEGGTGVKRYRIGRKVHWKMMGPVYFQRFAFDSEQYCRAIDEVVDTVLGPYKDGAERQKKELRLRCRMS